MKSFPSEIQFKFDWRKYQKRVLDELSEHLEDKHLHIIAPPGSGKTILGLEVALRLNRPTLIFAPTIAIRNQWVQRFTELFLQVSKPPNWISTSIKKPKFLTVVTYQSLHAACTHIFKIEGDTEENQNFRNKGTKQVIALLQEQSIQTIIMDEAHHLKNAWWKSLQAVKDALEVTVVGLTATPPYDVSYKEWQRYITLNGPVDAEISIPELVVEKNLCPHQDLVLFSYPTQEEIQKIYGYRERIQSLFSEIQEDKTLIDAIFTHPIIVNPKRHIYFIYSNIEYYSASLIFLNAVGKAIPEIHLEIVGDKSYEIPDLNYNWIEKLLTFYLYKDPYKNGKFEEHQEKLLNKLKYYGVVERTSINFIYNRKINNHLSTSISKLKNIDEIIDFEHQQLGNKLRMVVLTDYIRKEFLVNDSKNTLELNKIGVLPIFEKLRRSNDRKMKLGVLTGSLVIIPQTAYKVFSKIVKEEGITEMVVSKVPYDSNYLIVNTTHKNKSKIVYIITEVFRQGGIEVLVGTKSLLGEGWDAPEINSLILASFVGSFVLSNQMRGRSIRIDLKNPEKTGNIWHLACVDPTDNKGGDDVKLLRRRFKTFVGISFKSEATLENGIGRLDIPDTFSSEQEIASINNRMFKFASQRESLSKKWQTALKRGVTLVEEIKIPYQGNTNYFSIKTLYYKKTIKNVAGVLVTALAGFGLDSLRGLLKNVRSTKDLIYWILFTTGVGIVVFGKQAYKTARLYIKYRDISKDVQHMGEALLQTLVNMSVIKTDFSTLFVVTKIDEEGAIFCHLKGGSTFEKSTFILALQELIKSIDNPRYVIVRKSSFLKVISQRDYHAVPEIIGRKKPYAVDFKNQWLKKVGACDLIFTRNIEGRKLLLKSRLRSLVAQFDEDTIERVNKWR